MTTITVKENIVLNKNITVNKELLEEYINLVDLINSERDMILGNYIESDNYGDLLNYLKK